MSFQKKNRWFLLFLSAGAFVLCIVDYCNASGGNQSNENSNVDQELRRAINSFESQVSTMEQRIDLCELSLNSREPTDIAASSPQPTELSPEKLNNLEAKLNRILKSGVAQRKNASVGSSWTYWQFRRNKVLDDSLPLTERVFHMGYLRGNSMAFDKEVIEFVKKFAFAPGNVACRVNILRYIKGIGHPEFKAILIKALCSDTAAQAREEAAESLSFFSDDLEVINALKSAIASDASIAVRAQAQKSLGERDK